MVYQYTLSNGIVVTTEDINLAVGHDYITLDAFPKEEQNTSKKKTVLEEMQEIVNAI